MNVLTVENKGTITLGSKVMVSDPCYGLNTWCQGVLENVLPGEYECVVCFVDEGNWGTRVAGIETIHKDYVGKLYELHPEEFEVGVDSGQAGIFDYEYYAKYHVDCAERPHVNEEWYDCVCGLTYSYKENPNYEEFSFFDWEENKPHDAEWEKYITEKWIAYNKWLKSDKSIKAIDCPDANTIDNLGFVSSSGYGDGGYTCRTAKNNEGKIIAIQVEYITGDEEDE